MDSNKEVTKIKVSNEFVDIYTNFNVVTQVEKMKQLSKREQFLLLLVCLDKHSDEDPVVVHNFTDFKDECMQIFDIQDDKETEDEVLKELIKETGDKYIETDNLICQNGDKLPTPFTKEEVRDAKIDIINDGV
jgi:Fe-S-cluster formation regulator IscX/YfhJ